MADIDNDSARNTRCRFFAKFHEERTMAARMIVLVFACFLPFLSAAQPAENPSFPNQLPEASAETNTASPDLNDKCSGRGMTWTSVNARTGQRAQIHDGCQIENALEKAKAGWNALTKKDQALLEQIEQAKSLLEEANAYAETLDAESIELKANNKSLLAATDGKAVSRRELNRHNDTVKNAADKCLEYMEHIETMFATLLDLEQKTDFMQPEAQAALLEASTEIITGLEQTRMQLSGHWGALQGLQVHD